MDPTHLHLFLLPRGLPCHDSWVGEGGVLSAAEMQGDSPAKSPGPQTLGERDLKRSMLGSWMLASSSFPSFSRGGGWAIDPFKPEVGRPREGRSYQDLLLGAGKGPWAQSFWVSQCEVQALFADSHVFPYVLQMVVTVTPLFRPLSPLLPS